MSVSDAERSGREKLPQSASSPGVAENALTRLWRSADASHGRYMEAVAELQERNRKEQEARRPFRGRRRGGRRGTPDPEVATGQTGDIPVAGGRIECERCGRSVDGASSERVEIPSPLGARAAHRLCSRCADEVREGLLRLLAGQEPLPAPDPDEREMPLSVPARAGWFAFRMTAYGVIALVAFTLVTWLVLR